VARHSGLPVMAIPVGRVRFNDAQFDALLPTSSKNSFVFICGVRTVGTVVKRLLRSG
jgi:hypothetical protein